MIDHSPSRAGLQRDNSQRRAFGLGYSAEKAAVARPMTVAERNLASITALGLCDFGCAVHLGLGARLTRSEAVLARLNQTFDP